MMGYSQCYGGKERALFRVRAVCVPELCVFVKPVSGGCLVTFLLVLLTGACCFSITAGSKGGKVALLLACLLYPCTCTGMLVLQADKHLHWSRYSMNHVEKMASCSCT